MITTPFHDRYSNAEQLKAMQAMVPMNRLGSAGECAGTFVFLASDEMSGYVTGQVIEVNGAAAWQGLQRVTRGFNIARAIVDDLLDRKLPAHAAAPLRLAGRP